MISVIVAIYKKLDYLDFILQALERQSYKDFELVVAEDDNSTNTISFLDTARKKYFFPIQHVSQEDKGFRKNKILNAAVVASKGEFLVFIDGDCIPHRHFLKEYAKMINSNLICYGRRAMLSEKYTKQLLQKGSVRALGFFSAWFAGSKLMKAAIYMPYKKNFHKQHRTIIGCNWGIDKKNLLAINGFDEDYEKASVGEDLDVDWRLKKMGLTSFSIKNKAIVYHLYHDAHYNMDATIFLKSMMEKKVSENIWFCKNGIIKK
jgi:cellulose synthase/poly-beta-1,6-N-acetylglucosamine synthase-like glycosyltransferase